ncbi:hypothetical protein PXH66_07635 [Synoicihabitans lomoniglobus]|uniref:Uncharacterized protein n=1 Tax=Synoicihabitans lomoniglobus TaxID=2909285 RepID=A0AAF0I4D8_9BACT|nr:hypothetical protein PXH66_07635 [Opitutaceae bacterium LMO-M01]
MSLEQAVHEWRERRFVKKSFRDWVEERRNEFDEGLPEEAFGALMEMLTPMFLFLSMGHNQMGKGTDLGTYHYRAWVLLYCVRPDLLQGQTTVEAAQMFGCSRGCLTRVIDQFRMLYPDIIGIRNGSTTQSQIAERKKKLAA